MRRSKALPSKTVRKYRSVSQRRRISGNDDDEHDDTAEMDRLRRILAQSQAALGKSEEESSGSKRDGGKETRTDVDEDNKKSNNPYHGILSDDMVSNEYGQDNDADLMTKNVTDTEYEKHPPKMVNTPEELNIK